MFKDWLISDIERATQKSNRVVISDPSCFLTFIVKELTDYAVLTLNTTAEEMNARLQAQTSHVGSKVIFLCFFPSKDITQLMEFSGVGGFINLDNPDNYIREKLYKALGQNVNLPEKKLLLSARLSQGKSLTWWKGIVNETIEPLDLKEHLHSLIASPEEYQMGHDETVYDVVREDLFKLMNKPSIPVNAKVLLKELGNSIFNSLVSNNLTDSLTDIYYWWSNTSDIAPVLKELSEKWKMPANASPVSTHPDHPFEFLDRRLISTIGDKLRNNESFVDLTEALRNRVKSNQAINFKPKWLEDLLTLLEFDSSEIYRFNTLKAITRYYQNYFAPLDTAMRHLYNNWLAEPDMLRPLQELYESHLKVLLSAWFGVAPNSYLPSQLGLVAEALNSKPKCAIIVCDGLRLELAESIALSFGSSVNIGVRVDYAKLPSVTENGMSALFGLDIPVNQTSVRFNNLREIVPNVEILQHANLGNNVTADKLVILFGDIDSVGEHKGLGGLHDINNYEADLEDTIKRLHRLGYSEVFLTSDHGFVITGLLDEANKVPAPAGVDVKERFFLTDENLSETNFIQREDNFSGGKYQYYARTDKPFRTRGAYGYAHGGFTPQECLIPFYCFASVSDTTNMEVKIDNREELLNVVGTFFSVRLEGNRNSVGNRVKILLYANGIQKNSSIVRIDEEGNASAEFELTDDLMSVIIQDTVAGIQLDCASVKKSFSRDLDDLF